jgi:hypothetical protein
VKGKKHAAAFCLGQRSARDGTCRPFCQLRLANAATLAHTPEQGTDQLRNVLFRHFQIGVDLQIYVVALEWMAATEADAVPGVLGVVASFAGYSFAVAN